MRGKILPAQNQILLVGIGSPLQNRVADAVSSTGIVIPTRETTSALERLRRDIDVVLVDPATVGGAVAAVKSKRDRHDLKCSVGVFGSSSNDHEYDVDAILPRSLPDEELCERVERLILRARYRRRLAEYYAITVTLEGHQVNRNQANIDRAALAAQRRRLDRRLDELSDSFEVDELMRIALE